MSKTQKEEMETQTETPVKVTENPKALALRLHPDGIMVITISNVEKVGASVEGSKTCTVNGVIVKHTIQQVLGALGWNVSPVAVAE